MSPSGHLHREKSRNFFPPRINRRQRVFSSSRRNEPFWRQGKNTLLAMSKSFTTGKFTGRDKKKRRRGGYPSRLTVIIFQRHTPSGYLSSVRHWSIQSLSCSKSSPSVKKALSSFLLSIQKLASTVELMETVHKRIQCLDSMNQTQTVQELQRKQSKSLNSIRRNLR